MNSLNSWLPTQLSSAFGLVVLGVIFLIVAIAAMFAWRAISRPHVRGVTKNGRQSRLGLVDSYSVDRARQLVLVRRDNVEHLIMIGGPNDLLVESTILRARPAGQAPRPTSGNSAPAPAALPERPASIPAAPRQVEEDFARPGTIEPQPAAKVEPVTPPPVATITPAPLAPVIVTPTATTSGTTPVKPSVVPPREPGFFQRATSRFPNFNRPTTTGAAASLETMSESTPQQDEDEPRANIDTAHFEELLADDSTLGNLDTETKTAEKAEASAKPIEEFNYEAAEGIDIEPAPEAPEPTPSPATIRLPDLKLPEWRRPDAPAAPTPAPRPVSEHRVEPRFSPEPRPASELRPLGNRIEPTMAPPEPRGQADAPARIEPFRVGERLTTPTRPATPPPPPASATPAPTKVPEEPEDPFASLEEEMANLLGRTRDDSKKS